MVEGAGKYDDLATTVREKANARGVLVAVIQGDKGSGFSVQCDETGLNALPEMLEEIAVQIRKDLWLRAKGGA